MAIQNFVVEKQVIKFEWPAQIQNYYFLKIMLIADKLAFVC